MTAGEGGGFLVIEYIGQPWGRDGRVGSGLLNLAAGKLRSSGANMKTSTNKIALMQNKCLRTIAEAFKETPIPVLEAETSIALIDNHLDQHQAKIRYWLLVGGQAKFIATACKTTANI